MNTEPLPEPIERLRKRIWDALKSVRNRDEVLFAGACGLFLRRLQVGSREWTDVVATTDGYIVAWGGEKFWDDKDIVGEEQVRLIAANLFAGMVGRAAALRACADDFEREARRFRQDADAWSKFAAAKLEKMA